MLSSGEPCGKLHATVSDAANYSVSHAIETITIKKLISSCVQRVKLFQKK